MWVVQRARRDPAEAQMNLFRYSSANASVESLIAAHILNYASWVFSFERIQCTTDWKD